MRMRRSAGGNEGHRGIAMAERKSMQAAYKLLEDRFDYGVPPSYIAGLAEELEVLVEKFLDEQGHVSDSKPDSLGPPRYRVDV